MIRNKSQEPTKWGIRGVAGNVCQCNTAEYVRYYPVYTIHGSIRQKGV